MVGYVIEQINTSDLPPGTRAHALALLALCHHDNGHVAATWDALSHAMAVANIGTVRRHLGRMQAAGLIHYSSNGDGIVYVNFRAWQQLTRAWDLPKPRVETTETVAPTRGQDLTEPRPSVSGDFATRVETTETVDPTRARAPMLPKPRVETTETVAPTRGQPPQLVVCLNNSSPLPPGANQTTKHAPEPANDPADAARSFALLVDVGVSPAKAKELAAGANFDAIRRHVAAWLPEHQAQRQGVGLLITRIADGWGAPPPPPSWWSSELGQRHRTPAEIADAAREAQEAAELTAWQRAASPPDDERTAYLDDDPAWVALAAEPDPLLDKLAGLVEVANVDAVPLYRFAVRDPAFVGWLLDRGLPALRRRLTAIVGQPVLVEVTA